MTLLVLDVKVPISDTVSSEAELISEFRNITPTLLSYFMSFMSLGIFWTAHSLQFTYIDKSDRNLSWITIFYLMFICLLPFTTSFLSEHIGFRFPMFLYWLNLLIPGIIMLLHWNYAYSHGYIKKQSIDIVLITKTIRKRILIAQSLYTIAILLCIINSYVSIIMIILIQLNFAVAFRYNKDKLRSIQR